MRIVLIGAESTGLGIVLAAHLHLDHIRRLEEIAADGFVLDGSPRDLAEARTLGAVLRSRGADVDAVVWLPGGVLSSHTEAVLQHYRGRVVELNAGGDVLEAALSGLREAMLAA
ncbi:MAG: hypothetical protein ABI632_09665 [Pseudolysinimonas sp.]